ncbi:MAG: TonB-dependent receptor [Acidobacteria bacterium]|nr:TonB-dependent receptor [Acidobacteriota bacterium]
MNKFRTSHWAVATAALLTFLLWAVPSTAQVTTGSLQGVVFDPNKAIVANVSVKVTNTETGQERETQTNSQGFYRITNLIPGKNYKIEIKATGFAPKILENVPVLLGTENNVDVILSVATSQEVIQITGGAELIETTQSQLSTQYNTRQLTQLPFNGGAVDNLALLTPGILTPGDTDFTNGVGISANGNRGRSNNFQIDGQDNNDNSVAGPSLTLTNTEAVGAFQVITNTFSAEYGRNSGAQINLITKPGTNDFHGSVFEYLQNSALNARDNLDKKSQANFGFLSGNGFSSFKGLAGRVKDPFTYNRFGGSLGGPVKENKAFFFVTYQGDRQRGEFSTDGLGSSGVTFTPESAALAAQLFPNPATAALTSTAVGGGPAFVKGVGQFLIAPPVLDTNGDGIADTLAFGPGNPFVNPVSPNRLSAGLFANVGGVVTPLYFGEAARILRNDFSSDQVITRVDFNFTDKDILGLRYIYDNSRFPLAIGRFLAGAVFDVPSKNNNLGVTYTRTLGPRFVNVAQFNFSRLDVKFGDPEGTLPGPGISFSGTRNLNFDLSLAFGTQNNLPQSRKVDVYQYQNTLSPTLGNHAMKFGVDIRQQKVENFFLPNFLGTYTFSGSNPFLSTANATSGQIPSGTPFVFDDGTPRTGFRATAFENFLLGRPRQISFALGNPRINTNQDDFFFFVQDDWRLRPTFTLNLGARYEASTQPFNPIVEQVNAREADPSRAIFNQAFDLSTRMAQKIPTDKNNFAPRIGFAWQPNFERLGSRFTNGRFVLRGGFGISYDPSFFNIVLNTVTAAPFAAAGTFLQTPGAAGSVTFPFLPNTTAQLNTTPGTNNGDPRLFNQTRVDPNFHNPYTMSYNLGIQQELGANTVLEVRYVGSRIVGQFQTVNGNPNVQFLNRAAQCLGLNAGAFSNGLVVGTPAASAGDACIGAGFNNRAGATGNGRIDPNFGPVRLRINGASATYNSLQVRLDTRLAKQLTLNANYTFSRTIDNASEIFSTVGGGQGVADPQKFFDSTGGERGLSAFHQKHNFTANFIYDLPFLRDQRGTVGKLLGGYQLSSIMRFGSGRAYTPLNAFATYDPAFENGFFGIGALRPFNGNPKAPEGTVAFGFTAACGVLFGCDNVAGTPAPGNFIVFNTLQSGSRGTVVTNASAALQQARIIYNDFGLGNQFGVPLSSLEAFQFFRTPFGDLGRNTFSGLPFYLANFAIFKTTNITERYKVEFRVEANNILNHRNFGVPDPITEDAFTGFTVGSYQNSGFNNGGQRELRLGLRFLF